MEYYVPINIWKNNIYNDASHLLCSCILRYIYGIICTTVIWTDLFVSFYLIFSFGSIQTQGILYSIWDLGISLYISCFRLYICRIHHICKQKYEQYCIVGVCTLQESELIQDHDNPKYSEFPSLDIDPDIDTYHIEFCKPYMHVFIIIWFIFAITCAFIS